MSAKLKPEGKRKPLVCMSAHRNRSCKHGEATERARRKRRSKLAKAAVKKDEDRDFPATKTREIMKEEQNHHNQRAQRGFLSVWWKEGNLMLLFFSGSWYGPQMSLFLQNTCLQRGHSVLHSPRTR